MAGSCSLGKQNKQNIGSNTCVEFLCISRRANSDFVFCSFAIQDLNWLGDVDGNLDGNLFIWLFVKYGFEYLVYVDQVTYVNMSAITRKTTV